MSRALLTLTMVAWVAAPVLAEVGETWILPISHRQHEEWEGWTLIPGAGYEGTGAWQGSGLDWARVYWALSGIGSMGNEPPDETRLYTIESWAPTSGGTDWQPIESQFHGVDGEGDRGIPPDGPPKSSLWDEHIPWYGDSDGRNNHQWIGTDGFNDGDWHMAGPGPHTPENADYEAGQHGIYMWLTRGSWMYAAYNCMPGIEITRAWSALRLTQITPWGSCCLPDLTCIETTQDDCQAQEGVYNGDLTYCDDPDIFCCADPFADTDLDHDVDQDDFGVFQACYTGPEPGIPVGCECFDREPDEDVDGEDRDEFEKCATGPGITFNPEDETTWPGYGTEDACEGAGYAPP